MFNQEPVHDLGTHDPRDRAGDLSRHPIQEMFDREPGLVRLNVCWSTRCETHDPL